jgi:hypothetical protein
MASYNLPSYKQQTLELLNIKITEFNLVKNDFNNEYPFMCVGFVTAGYLCNLLITYRENFLLKYSDPVSNFYMPVVRPESFAAYRHRTHLWDHFTMLLIIPFWMYFVHYNNSIASAIDTMRMFRSFLMQHHPS